MLVWSQEEKDALAELINIGMGRAARSFGQMLDQEILLAIPSVEFLNRDELMADLAERMDAELVIVRQSFAGPLNGQIALLFEQDSSMALVNELLGAETPVEDLPDLEREAIAEVGNIVLNACMAALADTLDLYIPIDLPVFARGGPSSLIPGPVENEADRSYLVSRVLFDLKDRNIRGYVALLMSVPSARQLKQELARFMSSLQAVG